MCQYAIVLQGSGSTVATAERRIDAIMSAGLLEVKLDIANPVRGVVDPKGPDAVQAAKYIRARILDGLVQSATSSVEGKGDSDDGDDDGDDDHDAKSQDHLGSASGFDGSGQQGGQVGQVARAKRSDAHPCI